MAADKSQVRPRGSCREIGDLVSQHRIDRDRSFENYGVLGWQLSALGMPIVADAARSNVFRNFGDLY